MKSIKEVKTNSDYYSLSISKTKNALWDWNLLTNEVYYTPMWKNILGYKDDELENDIDTWEKLVKGEDRKKVLKKIQDCIDNKDEGFEVEVKMNHKNGSDVIILSHASLIRSDIDNKPLRFIGTNIDITEQKKSDFFIKKTNEILEMIAIGKKAKDIYVEIALMYESRHPGLRCSLLELEDGILLHGGAPSMPKEYCNAVHGLKNGPNVGSCGASTYLGRRIIVENIETDSNWAEIKSYALPHGMRCCWSEPIVSSTGKVLGAFGMYHDYPAVPNDEESEDLTSGARLTSIVMERDQAQKRIYKDQKFIEEQSKLASMGEMLSNIAHQWRQPLSSISSLSTSAIIQKEMNLLSNDDFNTMMNKINNSAQYLSQTIDDFRTFSKPKDTKISKFWISELIEKALSLVSLSFKDNKIEVIEDMEDIEILSLKNELVQVIMNILNNARDELSSLENQRKLILIKSYKEKDTLVIEITDNAGGIPNEIIDRIFEPYFTTKEKQEGTGIGLYMSQKIIKNLIESELKVENVNYIYEEINYTGARFSISIKV